MPLVTKFSYFFLNFPTKLWNTPMTWSSANGPRDVCYILGNEQVPLIKLGIVDDPSGV